MARPVQVRPGLARLCRWESTRSWSTRSAVAILRRRYGLDGADPMTLREIGEDPTLGLDVSRERIRQIEAKAITGARRAMRDRGISAGDVAWA